MTKRLTEKQETVLDLRQARMSYRQIGAALGIHFTTAREIHQAALKHINNVPDELKGMHYLELQRMEEAEYIDGQLRRYHELYDLCVLDKKYRNAIEALNGAHRYLETSIKMRGVAVPEKHDVRVSVQDLRQELMRIEAEVGEITEAEVVEFKQLGNK